MLSDVEYNLLSDVEYNLLSDVEHKPVNETEMKLGGNAKKKFLVGGGILVKQTNSILFDAVLSMRMRSLVSLFRSIRQTQSIPERTKLSQY